MGNSLTFTVTPTLDQATNIDRVCLDNGTGAVIGFRVLRNGSECAGSGTFTNPNDRCVNVDTACSGIEEGDTFQLQFYQTAGGTETMNRDFTFGTDLGGDIYFDSNGLAGDINVFFDRTERPTAAPSSSPTISVEFERTEAMGEVPSCAPFDDSDRVREWIQNDDVKVESVTWYYVPLGQRFRSGDLNGMRLRYSNGQSILHGSEGGIDGPRVGNSEATLSLDWENGEYISDATINFANNNGAVSLQLETSNGQSFTNPSAFSRPNRYPLPSPVEGDALYGFHGRECQSISFLGALYFDPLLV